MGDEGTALSMTSGDTVREIASNLKGAAGSYLSAIASLQNAVDSSKNYWTGEDAEAYRAKINTALAEEGPFKSVATQINSHAAFLESSAAEIDANQAAIKNAIG